jgi:hypothetical protein
VAKLFLLDASVLIAAQNTYYPLDSVPEFWSWLEHTCETGIAKIPLENFEEVKEGRKDRQKDPLYAWIQQGGMQAKLVFDEQPDPVLIRKVVSDGYAKDLTDSEVEQLGRDPFLIACALTDIANRCVVTGEASKPARKRQNRHIPDVCKTLGVDCCNPFDFFKQCGFKTGWKNKN